LINQIDSKINNAKKESGLGIKNLFMNTGDTDKSTPATKAVFSPPRSFTLKKNKVIVSNAKSKEKTSEKDSKAPIFRKKFSM